MTDPNDPAVGSEHSIPSGQGGSIPAYWKHKGLTKREYFAAMAMQGLCSDRDIGVAVKTGCDKTGISVEVGIARMALTLADALIAELNKSNG